MAGTRKKGNEPRLTESEQTYSENMDNGYIGYLAFIVGLHHNFVYKAVA